MSALKVRLLAALPIVVVVGVAPGPICAEGAAEAPPPSQQASQVPGQPDSGQVPAQAEAKPAPQDAGAETGSEADAPSAADADQATAEGAAETETPAPEPEPVTGAFGIPLGARFDPCLVAKVLGEQEKTYRTPDKIEHKGIRYQVEPKVPNPHFNAYAVLVNENGIVYGVQADQEPAEKVTACKVTKRLAELLEEKYGKARAQDGFGYWYAFRDMSAEQYRGVRLNAPKCRYGRYSIVYSDDAAKLAETPPEPETGDAAGL